MARFLAAIVSLRRDNGRCGAGGQASSEAFLRRRCRFYLTLFTILPLPFPYYLIRDCCGLRFGHRSHIVLLRLEVRVVAGFNDAEALKTAESIDALQFHVCELSKRHHLRMRPREV